MIRKKLTLWARALYGGCYNDRPIRGNPGTISNHSFGAAIDIDPAKIH